MGNGLDEVVVEKCEVSSLVSSIEKAAETIAVKARAINRLLEWQKNPGYAEFVNRDLEILKEYKELVKDEYKEFSCVVREAFSQRDTILGFSVCYAAYNMFVDFLELANEKRDHLFYHLGLAYFNSYHARFFLLIEKKEQAEIAMQRSKRHYNLAINLDLDKETKEKIEKIIKKTEQYLKLYRPRKKIPTIGITEEDVKDEKVLFEKTQRLHAKLNKHFPHLFETLYYPEELIENPSYDEIIEQYLDGELDLQNNVA